MASPLDNIRASNSLAGSRRSSTTPGTAARRASPHVQTSRSDDEQGDDVQPSPNAGQEQDPSRQQHQQHQQQQQQQQQSQPQGQDSYDHHHHHHHHARTGYRPAQVRRLPFDMSTYAHFMLTHTKHQMDAVPDAAPPPPAHLSIAGLPSAHRPSSRTASTASPSNGISR